MGRTKKSAQIDRWVKRQFLKHACKCDCGYAIDVKRIHFRTGIPDFLPGHNLSMTPEEITKAVEHKESSWDYLTPEEKELRLSKIKPFQSGEDNPAWKGGRRVDEKGYVQVITPGHPFSKDNYIAEHRLVVEEWFKKNYPNSELLIEIAGEKYLRQEAVVHHVDEVKTNNKISNLMLLDGQKFHSFIHRSPLPMNERIRRISVGIYHSKPLKDNEYGPVIYPWILNYLKTKDMDE